MDEKKLMLFIQKILQQNSKMKASTVLEQLLSILKEQKTDQHLIHLVNMTMESIPEAKELAQSKTLTAKDIEIAKHRADDRKFREAQMNSYRGCR